MSLTWQKLRVVFKRDLLVSLRLRSGLASAVSLLFEIFGLYFLARSVGAGYHPEGMDYFAFAIVGTAFVNFLLAGMGVFVRVVQEFQSNGTLEIFLSSRTSPMAVIALNAVPSLVRYGIGLLFTFLTAYAVLSGNKLLFDPVTAVVVFLLALLLIAALGMIAAAVQLLFRKGTAVLWISGSAAWLLSGAMYPVSALPVALQKIAMLLPVTYAINAFRGAALRGAGFQELSRELLILCGLIAILGPLAIVCVNGAVRLARQRGLLTLY